MSKLLSVMSVYEPERVAALLCNHVLPAMRHHMPSNRVAIDQQLARIAELTSKAVTLQRLSVVSVVFWWLYTQYMPFAHLVEQVELDHGVSEAAVTRMRTAAHALMLTVRQSPFEPWNTFPYIVRDFYTTALSLFGMRDTTLLDMYASVQTPEKLPRTMKAERAAPEKKRRNASLVPAIRARAVEKAESLARSAERSTVAMATTAAAAAANANTDTGTTTTTPGPHEQQQQRDKETKRDERVQYI
jgi:hypothetical protein